jgi:hypothetical protein
VLILLQADICSACKRVAKTSGSEQTYIAWAPPSERVEGGRDVLRSLNVHCRDAEAKSPGCCLHLAHLHHGSGIAGIGHDGQPAELRHNLAQEFECFRSQIGILK